MNYRKLAQEFGTPLFIYDEAKIENQIEEALTEFASKEFKTEVVFASKAFSSIYIFKLFNSKGLGIDVVSGGELYGAIEAKVDMSKVYFHGNNKSDEEITMAINAGVGYFVIDNSKECERLAECAKKYKKQVKALLRVNPGISAHTHEYIMTSAPDSKFGIHVMDKPEINKVIDALKTNEYVQLAGFHHHIGSQIVDVESFRKAIDTMTDFLAEIKNDHGMDNLEVSIGGGFGIKYVDEDHPVSLGGMCKNMIGYMEEYTRNKGIKISKMITEPGRAMVGEAGKTLYTIGDMKKSGEKNYLFIDGGMSDNIRPVLYDAEYKAELPEKIDKVDEIEYCVAGKNCESGDVLIKNIKLPKAEKGDLLLMFSTGAYGYSMASNYNKLPRPAVVFVKGENAKLVIKRESYADLYSNEIID